MGEICEVCGRPKCSATGGPCEWDGRECHGGVDCYSRGYERSQESLAAANARADEYRTNWVSEEARRIKAESALATARRERDEARALAEKWAMREAAGVERGIRADADALSEIQGLQAVVERLRGDLVKYGSHVDGCNGDDFCSCGLEVARLQAARAALAAPAAASGEERTR